MATSKELRMEEAKKLADLIDKVQELNDKIDSLIEEVLSERKTSKKN